MKIKKITNKNIKMLYNAALFDLQGKASRSIRHQLIFALSYWLMTEIRSYTFY